MRILVGLSGGVDSAVAALILKQQGHEIIGATMSICGKNNMPKTGHRSGCYSPDEKEDIEEARKIAKFLDIPHFVIDCTEQYEKNVIDYFKSEYLQGHTPNPCVRCNAVVKFGAFQEIARANGITFDKFATGHYARIEEENGRYILKRGVALNKDQSYFLYRLSQDQLKDILLPLGTFTKEEIRAIAKENNIPVAEKRDSQDFYDGDYNELLGVKAKPGNIVDLDGKILGKHDGIWNYTVGQRKGIGISAPEPLYVLSLNKETNEVVVGPKDKTFQKSLIASNLNWVGIDLLSQEIKAQAKIRSTQQPVGVTVIPKGSEIEVVFDDWQKSIAIGQSVVIYDGDKVLGGGIIESA